MEGEEKLVVEDISDHFLSVALKGKGQYRSKLCQEFANLTLQKITTLTFHSGRLITICQLENVRLIHF